MKIVLSLLISLLLLSPILANEQKKLGPADFNGTTVCVTRYYSEEERKVDPKTVGAQFTACFFQSTKYLLTIGHTVTTNPPISKDKWIEVHLSQQEKPETDSHTQVNRLRLVELVKCPGEELAILELENLFVGATVPSLRREPLSEKSEVFGIGYTSGNLCYVGGTFHYFAGEAHKEEQAFGFDLFELFKDSDRLAFDNGASGSPIFDKEGKVVAIVCKVHKQDILEHFSALKKFAEIKGPMIASTPWGVPNILAVPITKLLDFKWPE